MANPDLDALLETLRAIMPSNPAAKFRLRDILPVEISLVDRAANKRRFLTIKHSDGVNIMPTLLKVDLPADIRENVEKALENALQQLYAITEAVAKGAASEDAKVPEDFQKALGGVIDHLGSVIEKEAPSDLGTEASDKLKAIAAAIATIAEADSPDSVTDMIGRLMKLSAEDTKEAATLKALGELSIALSDDPKENDALSAGTMEKVQVLTAKLGELVAEPVQEPATTKDDNSEPAAKTDEPTADDKPADPEPAAKTDEPEPVAEPTADPEPTAEPVAEPTADPTQDVEKVGAKMSRGRLSQLRNALKILSDVIEDLAPPVAKTDEPEPAKDPEPAPIDVAKMEQQIQDLKKQVSTLLEKPVAPASRKVEGNPGTGTKSPVPDRKQPRKTRWIV